MTPFRLIALDLDGTLLPFDGVISDRSQRTLERASSGGIVVTLASGRPFPAMLQYVEKLAIGAPIICNQGAQIVHPDTHDLMHNAAIPLAPARALLEYLQPLDVDVMVDLNEDFLVRAAKFSEEFFSDFVGRPYDLVTDMSAGLCRRPSKVLIMNTAEENEHLLTALQKRFGHLIRLLRSHPMFIEGIPLGENKATALQRVTEKLGIPQEQTMAIGDGDNDIEMVAWAGLGVAMGNASPGVKAVADYIAPRAEDDGAAEAIERFCLNR